MWSGFTKAPSQQHCNSFLRIFITLISIPNLTKMRFITSKAILASMLLAAGSLASSDFPKTIYQFPNPTWVENIFATRNGSLLASVVGSPELHLIDPFAGTASLVATFPEDTNATFGVTELTPDVFAVVRGNYSWATGTTDEGSYSVWKIHLNTKSTTPRFAKIADIPEALLLNGMTSLNDHVVLIADSKGGLIWKLDISTGKYSVAIDHPSLKPVEGASIPIGVNGVKKVDEYLYYTNTFQNIVNRVKVDGHGAAAGPFQTIASNLTIPDDLVVLDDGTIFTPRPFANTVERVHLDGKVETVVGNLNSSVVAGGTSVTLGRTWRDRNVGYVSTTGGVSQPVNGTFVEGGKIVAILLDSKV
jgi:hypothetical protein